MKTEWLQSYRKKSKKTTPKLEKSEGLKISEGPPSAAAPFVAVCPLLAGLGHSSTVTPWCPGCHTPGHCPHGVGTHSFCLGQLSWNSRNSLSCRSRNLPLWYFNIFKSRSAGTAWSQCTVASGILLGLRLADSCFSPRSHKLT